jgi:hypothetical protein
MGQEPTTKSNPQRRSVLAPYLVQLKALQAGRAPGSDMQLDAWERSVLGQIDGSASAPGNEWPVLVAEGIAFRTKFESDLRRLSEDPDAFDVVRAQLVTDAAVGLALMAETQQSVSLMVLSGKIDSAKKLSGFRNKIVQGVSIIRETIGDTAFGNAETLSRNMTSVAIEPARTGAVHAAGPTADDTPDEAAPAGHEPIDMDALLGEIPDAFIRRNAAPGRNAMLRMPDVGELSPRRVKWLAISLGVLVLAWSVLVLPRLGKPTPLPILTQQSMPQSAAIQQLTARPPSLFIEVGRAEWKSMPSIERRQLVKEIGVVAEASGYTGVQLRDTDGNSVAQWLKSQGVWLASAAITN